MIMSIHLQTTLITMKIMTITLIIIKDISKHITSVEDSTYLVLVELLAYKAILRVTYTPIGENNTLILECHTCYLIT